MIQYKQFIIKFMMMIKWMDKVNIVLECGVDG